MNTGIIVQLKSVLPETSWPWVVRALRQEPLCWQALTEETDLMEKALAHCGEDGENWTPANLFYLTLGKPDLLNSEPDNEKLGKQGSATFKLLVNSARESWQIKISLQEAGFVAYYIFQQWNKYKDWDHILGELEQLPKEIWRPIFACLYGMFPNPDKYFYALLQPEHSEDLHNLSIHAYLSNPFSLTKRKETLMPLLAESPIQNRVDLTKQIQGFRADLAKMLAQQIIIDNDLNNTSSHSELDITTAMLMFASLHQIAGDHETAIQMLEAAGEISRKYQADFGASLAQEAARSNDSKSARAALDIVDGLGTDLQDSQKVVVAARIHTGQLDPAVLNGHNPDGSFKTENPAALLAAAQLAFLNGDKAQAREASQVALIQLLNDSAYEASQHSPEDLTTLAELLLSLGEPIEAVQAAELALGLAPSHIEALFVYSQGQQKNQQIQDALNSAHMAVALSPEENRLREHLKDLLLANENWASALHELETLTTRSHPPLLTHFIELAACAIQVQELQKATAACQAALKLDPEHGLAHFYMGQAIEALGDKKSASLYYEDAVRYAPEQAEIWLALAITLVEEEKPIAAREILERGLVAVEKPLEIHLALGKIIAAQESDSNRAHAHLQAAFDLIDANTLPITQVEIITALGNQWYLEAAFNLALELLEQGNLKFPNTLELVHLLGKTQLSLGMSELAQGTLATARELNPTKPEVLLDLAQAYLATSGNTDQAIEIIKTAQQLELDNPLPCALLGQAYLQQGKEARALKMFQLAQKSDLKNNAYWQKEMTQGIALAACGVGQPEVAIAALSEALELDADDLTSRKILCKAYIQANLKENAFIQLEVIGMAAQEDAPTILWAGETALELGDEKIAQEYLYALNPNQQPPTVLLPCGQLWLQMGKEEIARKHLGMLLKHESSNPTFLQDAANAWLEAGRVEESIPYLEKAVSLDEKNSEDLLQDLTHAYYQSGKFNEALTVVEQRLSENPGHPDYLLIKARLHTNLRQIHDALNVYYDLLDLGAEIEGGQEAIYYQVAKLEWEQGNLLTALSHAERAYELAPHEQKHQYLAAELNYACLNYDRTKIIIGESYENPASKLNWIFLQAENALRHNEEIIATDLILPILELAADHPRLLAIQAMLSFRLGQQELAKEQFEQALSVMGNLRMDDLQASIESNIDLTIVQTAIDLGIWESALFLARHVLERIPSFPRAHLMIAKTLILRAEYTHLCDDLHVTQNRATVHAASPESYQVVQAHLTACEENSSLPSDHPILSHWQLRAKMAFENEWISDFPLNHSSSASAWVAVARRTGNFDYALEKSLPFQDSAAVASQLTLAMIESKDTDSLKHARQTLKQNPRSPLWLALVGLTAQAQERWAMMEQSFEQAVKYWAHEPDWHYFMAVAAMEQHKTKAAIQHLERASHDKENYLPHLILLGKAYLQDGAPGQAARVLEKASQQAPQQADIWELLAKSYAAMQEYGKADKAALRFSKIVPSKTGPLELRAKVALQAKAPEKALHMAEAAIRNHSSNHRLLSIQAKALNAMGQISEAIQALDRAILQADEPLPYLLERAEMVGAEEGITAELNTLVALAQKYPDQPQVLAALSISLKKNGQLDEAVRAAQHALRKNNGELDTAAQSKTHYQLGLILKEMGQLDQAIHHLDKSIEYHPGDVEPYLVMGQTYHKRRNYKPAINYYRKAIELAPDDARPYFEAARSLKECKNYTTAEAMLRQAVKLKPKDLVIYRQLVEVMSMNLVHNPSA